VIADVGQGAWEEVDVQPAGSSGGQNYGWRLMEGRHCFNPASNCSSPSLTLPVVEYSHALGCSITGGFVYRGTLLTGHAGTYFFADYCSGRIWGTAKNPDGTWTATQLLTTGLTITTFGENEGGEIFLSNYNALYRLVPATATRRLTIAALGKGTGRVTSSPLALECGSICAAYFSSGTAVTLTATADAGSKFSGWGGDADCADAAVTLSADRSCTARFDLGFIDDSIVPTVTPVKASHILELRSRIDALRSIAGLPVFAWTNPNLTTAIVIQAVHVTEMRTAVNQLYTAAGRSVPSYTDPGLPPGTFIKAIHISELRSAVVGLE